MTMKDLFSVVADFWFHKYYIFQKVINILHFDENFLKKF